MSRVHLYVLAAVLALAGMGVAAYKVIVLKFPLTAQARSELWQVEVQLRFEGTGGPAKVTLNLPRESPRATVLDEGFAARGYGVTTEVSEANRRAVYAISEAPDRQYLYYRVTFDITRPGLAPAELPPTVRAPALNGGELAAAQAIADAARGRSADARTLAAAVVARLRQARPGDEASYLLGPDPTPARLVTVAVAVLRIAGVRARIVHGLALRPARRDAHFVRWLEVYEGRQWFAVHPVALQRDELRTLVPWWRGPGPLASLEGGKGLAAVVSVGQSYELALRAAVAQRRAAKGRLIDFSLQSLPLQAQMLFRILLVVPLGVFLLVVLRNVVGFKTFGTFMPVLMALAFRWTGLGAGLAFFGIVLASSLAVRFYFERLKLLLVPRLAAVLIVVVMVIGALTVLSHRLGLDVGLSIGLFPIVILTMTVERMAVTWEERGPAEALQQAAGSLLVAALCFGVMRMELVEHVLFVFPELLLVLLSATLLLGRYSGYRLLELYRFRVLAR